jgi:hypothetical protein
LQQDEIRVLSIFATNGTKTEVIYGDEQPLFSLVSKGILKQAGEYHLGGGMYVDRNVYALTPETNTWIRDAKSKDIFQTSIAN